MRALCLALALVPAGVLASPEQDARHDLAAHRAAAAAAQVQARADSARAALLAGQQVRAAAALRLLEDQTANDAQQMAGLAAAQAQAGQRLAAAQGALGKLLPVMQRLASQPAATLLAVPQSPRDAVRGILILQGVAASIAFEAGQVRTQNAALAVLRAKAEAAAAQLAAAVSAQQGAEATLNTQIAGARAAEMADSDVAAREAAASLLAERKLDSIAAAVVRLGSHASRPADLPAGGGGAPVAGHILQEFGAATLAGPAQGLSYSAAPGARVTTPCAGTVIFAGAFPAYGLMVITDCGGGTSVILAGMKRLDVATGERLAHGQPVGAMLGYDPADPARQPVLYVELRQNGAPVDPAPWLADDASG